MFPSTYNSNPFPCFPSSSSYPPLSFLVDPENYAFANNNNTLLLHDPLAAPFMPTYDAPIPESATNLLVEAESAAMLRKDAKGNGGIYNGISNFVLKRPAKKDRHSKIQTSQGLRDRRVRLSSEIARKFFDLQDMLQYDKPSNTLEWLFTKSENAIKELARSKHNCSEVDKCLFCFSSSDKSLREDHVSVQAKEESSRARVRRKRSQRTSYKMCSGTGTGRVVDRDYDLEERFPAATSTPEILHHQMMPPFHPQYLVGSEAPGVRDGFDVIEESFVMKRNLKPSNLLVSLSSHHNQNLAIPKEGSFNHSLPNSPPTWDTNGRSNFTGRASMNLTTELQIFGKSLEECTNKCRH